MTVEGASAALLGSDGEQARARLAMQMISVASSAGILVGNHDRDGRRQQQERELVQQQQQQQHGSQLQADVDLLIARITTIYDSSRDRRDMKTRMDW